MKEWGPEKCRKSLREQLPRVLGALQRLNERRGLVVHEEVSAGRDVVHEGRQRQQPQNLCEERAWCESTDLHH